MSVAEIPWYNINSETAEALRNFLIHRQNKAERALNALNMENLDFINNFTEYVTIDDATRCGSLFRGSLPYVIGNIIGKGKVGQVSLLTNSNKIQLIIKSMSATAQNYLSLRIINYPGEDINPNSNYWNIYGEDGVRKILAVGGDNFANQTSLHFILNLILGDSPYYIHQYDAFYCNGSGYNVIEFSNAGDLHSFLERNSINEELIVGMLKHVLIPLAALKHPMYNFNHSDLKAKNVFVHETSEGNTFKIADYDKCSITWNGYRFYNWSQNYGIATPIKIEKDINGSDTYVLSSMVPLQIYTMHNPYGIPGSYDIYTFIISLFAVNNVWKKYINGEFPLLKQLMHRLFPSELYYIIMGKIAQDHSAVASIAHINTLINGMYLLYDVSFVYELAGVQPPPLSVSNAYTQKITVSKDSHLCTDACQLNIARNKSSRSCTTNAYSKKGFTGASTVYKWDYC